MSKVLITGVAGFIGSHLLSHCLSRGDIVTGIDNLSTGNMENIHDVLCENHEYSSKFKFIYGDICDKNAIQSAVKNIDVIFHEAAVVSVPYSIQAPEPTHATNLTAFVSLLEAAKKEGIRRIIYASSSAVFGNANTPLAIEGQEGTVLSPYAATKRAQEIYAQSWAHCYSMQLVGLRYFNVFGKRQNPNGAYAAVIPRWIHAMLNGKPCAIFGDGSATRDFCHVDNIVSANILASQMPFAPQATALNIGCSKAMSLMELFQRISEAVTAQYHLKIAPPDFQPKRFGDIEHSVASIELAKKTIGYHPIISAAKGIQKYVAQIDSDHAFHRKG